jgi:glycosyltransferase involved in cell wall biosynthesis
MKIIVFAVCYNQAEILPWFLRHYSSFADEISVFDDHSTDGSREILQAHPKVKLRDWPHEPGINEDIFLDFAYEWYPKAHPDFDWAIWVDCDELIYAPDVRAVLESAKDFEVIRTTGYNMTGDGLPQGEGDAQLWQIMPYGISAEVYSKPVVFRPSAHVRWSRGKHRLESECKTTPRPLLKLLHYRYLGGEYTARLNAKNFDRCGLQSGDKGAAWSCSPSYRGEHSAEWAEGIKHCRWNVIEAPLPV